MTRDPALALARSPLPLSTPERKGPSYWGSVHLAGDRRQPIVLGDRRKRQPSGTSIGFWQRGRKESAVYE